MRLRHLLSTTAVAISVAWPMASVAGSTGAAFTVDVTLNKEPLCSTSLNTSATATLLQVLCSTGSFVNVVGGGATYGFAAQDAVRFTVNPGTALAIDVGERFGLDPLQVSGTVTQIELRRSGSAGPALEMTVSF